MTCDLVLPPGPLLVPQYSIKGSRTQANVRAPANALFRNAHVRGALSEILAICAMTNLGNISSLSSNTSSITRPRK